jgi:NADH:ubiquinone oxidoreductase subunit E
MKDTMAWKTIDRRSLAPDDADAPLLSDEVKERIRRFVDRYPVKRAALLPALHIVQDTYGVISHRAMRDIAELLEITPAQVLDTVTFYTHFWQKPRGRKVIVSCRGLSCELVGARELNEAIARHLGIGEHETTPDGEYSFVTEECLGACEHAPCLLINERLHTRVRAEDVPALLADADNDKLEVERSDLYDGVKGDAAIASKAAAQAAQASEGATPAPGQAVHAGPDEPAADAGHESPEGEKNKRGGAPEPGAKPRRGDSS